MGLHPINLPCQAVIFFAIFLLLIFVSRHHCHWYPGSIISCWSWWTYQEVLRDTWLFRGLVVSDWWANRTTTKAQGSECGFDMVLPAWWLFFDRFLKGRKTKRSSWSGAEIMMCWYCWSCCMFFVFRGLTVHLPSLKLANRPWKWMVGRLLTPAYFPWNPCFC